MSAPIQTLVVETSPPGVALAEHVQRSTAMATAEPVSVGAMIMQALERNVPVESLEKLVALHERVTDREAAKEFAQALAAFQQECPEIRKAKTADVATKSGGKYSFTYAPLPEIQRTIAPYLAKHGLSYGWDAVVERDQLKCVCTLRHLNGHSASSSFTLPVDNPSAASPQQKVGMAYTFAQRRTLGAVLGITIDDDHPETPQADPRPITDDQATVIADLIKEAGANLKKFLAHFEIERVEDLRAVQYDEAVTALQQLKKKREAAK